MSSRRRITVALVGLLVLVVVGWLVRDQAGASERTPRGAAVVVSGCPRDDVGTSRAVDALNCLFLPPVVDSNR